MQIKNKYRVSNSLPNPVILIILALAGGPLFRVATIRRTTDTHYRNILFISHTTNVLLFKFSCSIFNAGFGNEWDTLYISALINLKTT